MQTAMQDLKEHEKLGNMIPPNKHSIFLVTDHKKWILVIWSINNTKMVILRKISELPENTK